MEDRPTVLWALRRGEHAVTCAARLLPYGIEVDIAHDGQVALTRVFETDDEALAWAAQKRAAREEEGWQAGDALPSETRH